MIVTGFDSLVQHVEALLGTDQRRVVAERVAQVLEDDPLRPQYGHDWSEDRDAEGHPFLWERKIKRMARSIFHDIRLSMVLDGEIVGLAGDVEGLGWHYAQLAERGLSSGGQWSLVGEGSRDVFRAALFRGSEEVGFLELSGTDHDTLVHIIESVGDETGVWRL